MSEDAPPGVLISIPLVVVCDNRELVRAGVHHLLTRVGLVREVISFTSVKEAVAGLPRPRPDGTLAVVGGSAVDELTDPTREGELDLPLVVLLASTEPYELSAAAELAATGYILEASLSGRTLRSALELVALGETTMPGQMAELLLRRARRSRAPLSITPRQQAVLQMIAGRATNRAVAAELGLSVHAVKRDVAALLTAMGCSNRTEATVRALRDGLIPRSGLR